MFLQVLIPLLMIIVVINKSCLVIRILDPLEQSLQMILFVCLCIYFGNTFSVVVLKIRLSTDMHDEQS